MQTIINCESKWDEKELERRPERELFPNTITLTFDKHLQRINSVTKENGREIITIELVPYSVISCECEEDDPDIPF